MGGALVAPTIGTLSWEGKIIMGGGHVAPKDGSLCPHNRKIIMGGLWPPQAETWHGRGPRGPHNRNTIMGGIPVAPAIRKPSWEGALWPPQ